MKRRAVVAVVALVVTAALLSGCGSNVSSTEQSQQQSVVTAEASFRSQGFTKVTLRIRHADGTVEEHCVWLADTDFERVQGLKEITDPSLGGGDALVFQFESDTALAFWMKDTLLPLSIAWVDSAGGVVNTADMDPCLADTESCPRFPPGRPYRLAIEMAQGRLQDWGIRPGATISLGASC
jgi:uncharacterized membrane protein (UPF0127 family)